MCVCVWWGGMVEKAEMLGKVPPSPPPTRLIPAYFLQHYNDDSKTCPSTLHSHKCRKPPSVRNFINIWTPNLQIMIRRALCFAFLAARASWRHNTISGRPVEVGLQLEGNPGRNDRGAALWHQYSLRVRILVRDEVQQKPSSCSNYSVSSYLTASNIMNVEFQDHTELKVGVH